MESLFGDVDEDEDDCNNTRPKECGVLSFHTGTEEALFVFVDSHVEESESESEEERCGRLLGCIDEFCYSRHWMMHIGLLPVIVVIAYCDFKGDKKSIRLKELLKQMVGRGDDKPLVMVELGCCYCCCYCYSLCFVCIYYYYYYYHHYFIIVAIVIVIVVVIIAVVVV